MYSGVGFCHAAPHVVLCIHHQGQCQVGNGCPARPLASTATNYGSNSSVMQWGLQDGAGKEEGARFPLTVKPRALRTLQNVGRGVLLQVCKVEGDIGGTGGTYES